MTTCAYPGCARTFESDNPRQKYCATHNQGARNGSRASDHETAKGRDEVNRVLGETVYTSSHLLHADSAKAARMIQDILDQRAGYVG